MAKFNFLTMQQETAAALAMDLGDSAQATLVKRWLNMVVEDVNSREDWPWLFDREVVQTVIDKTAGTVDVAASATTVTGTGTAFAASDVGSFIQFSSSDDWYKITARASATSLTIEKDYVKTTALSAGTYKIRKVFYSCSADVDRILSIRQAISPKKLTLIYHRTLDDLQPRVDDEGSPEAAHIWGLDSSGNWQFSLFPTPDSVMNLEVRFRKRITDLSADADTSDIPAKWNNVVVIDGTIARGMTYKSDERADKWFARYELGIDRMLTKVMPEADSHPVFQSVETVVDEVGIEYPADYPRR